MTVLFALSATQLFFMSTAVQAQFDELLEQDALAIADAVEENAAADEESGLEDLEGFHRTHRALEFQVLLRSGEALYATTPMRLPRRPATGMPIDAALGDGRRGRLFAIDLPPGAPRGEATDRERAPAMVVVFRSTQELDATVARFRALLALTSLMVLASAFAAVTLAIRGGLEPVHDLQLRLAKLEAFSLSTRLEPGTVPAELAPVVTTLNETLSKLEASFERERRFSADVSHELRTPLASLRALLEVTMSRPRRTDELTDTANEALGLTLRMSGLVEKLLLLARVERTSASVSAEPVALRELVEEHLAALESRFRGRQLAVSDEVGTDEVLTADRRWLAVVVSNLLSNAADYTSEGGWVRVLGKGPDGVLFEVRDSGPPIPEGSLDAIFERFARLDTARTGDGGHLGLGLALVRECCRLHGWSVCARNAEDGSVAFQVRALLASTA